MVCRVILSASDTGVYTSYFPMTTGTTANNNLSRHNALPISYTVTVNSITGTGSLRLDLNASGTGIVDGASNANTTGLTNGDIVTASPADDLQKKVVNIVRSSPTQQHTTAPNVLYGTNVYESD